MGPCELPSHFFTCDWVACSQAYRYFEPENIEQLEKLAQTDSGPKNPLAEFERKCYGQGAKMIQDEEDVNDFFIGAAIAANTLKDKLRLIVFASGDSEDSILI